ncbi:hypothetical protein CTI12_AA564390 [Artemisia annua]|uniref:Uncharacterized protein n=1 Tax=Artemisia annua TaxID=35608 RepID=A0A2U1KTS6_ARTAN|nr:hypothetical protein CTI12_AA564390 [Artemisia annua]
MHANVTKLDHTWNRAVDIISAIEFDKFRDLLATRDRGGRVVLFERFDRTDHVDSRRHLEEKDCSSSGRPEFRYKTEFQSHDPEHVDSRRHLEEKDCSSSGRPEFRYKTEFQSHDPEVLGNARGAVAVVVSILIFRNTVSVTEMAGYTLTIRQLKQKAQNLPNKCDLQVQSCPLPTIITTTTVIGENRKGGSQSQQSFYQRIQGQRFQQCQRYIQQAQQSYRGLSNPCGTQEICNFLDDNNFSRVHRVLRTKEHIWLLSYNDLMHSGMHEGCTHKQSDSTVEESGDRCKSCTVEMSSVSAIKRVIPAFEEAATICYEVHLSLSFFAMTIQLGTALELEAGLGAITPKGDALPPVTSSTTRPTGSSSSVRVRDTVDKEEVVTRMRREISE